MQVTIIGTNNALCDALSTACFVLGLDAGMKLADTYNVTAIFVDEDKNVWFNQENVLDMLDFIGSESGYSLQIYDR